MSGESLGGTLAYTRRRIAELATDAGRSQQDVQLILDAKLRPPKAIRAAVRYGQLAFAEQDVDAWIEKADALCNFTEIQWHMSGYLDEIDVRRVVGRAALIHRVGRRHLLDEIAAWAERPQPILIEINMTGDVDQPGCMPDMAEHLVRRAIQTGLTPPRGLMSASFDHDTASQAQAGFERLRALRDAIRASLEVDQSAAAAEFSALSMGNSRTLGAAIDAGATMVLIGTEVFGARPDSGGFQAPNEHELPPDMR